MLTGKVITDDMDLSALFGIDLDLDQSVLEPASLDYAAGLLSGPNKCSKCRGTGRFRTYGKCFACTGTGLVNKPAVNSHEFANKHPTIAFWIETNPANEFAASMGRQIAERGYLTPNQLVACQRIVERNQTPVASVAIDVSRIRSPLYRITLHENTPENRLAFGVTGS